MSSSNFPGVSRSGLSGDCNSLSNLVSFGDGSNYVPLKEVLESLEGLLPPKMETQNPLDFSIAKNLPNHLDKFAVFLQGRNESFTVEQHADYWNAYPKMLLQGRLTGMSPIAMAGVKDYYLLGKHAELYTGEISRLQKFCSEGYLICSEHISYQSHSSHGEISPDFFSNEIHNLSRLFCEQHESASLTKIRGWDPRGHNLNFLQSLCNTEDSWNGIVSSLKNLSGMRARNILIKTKNLSVDEFYANVVMHYNADKTQFIIDCGIKLNSALGYSMGCIRRGY